MKSKLILQLMEDAPDGTYSGKNFIINDQKKSMVQFIQHLLDHDMNFYFELLKDGMSLPCNDLKSYKNELHKGNFDTLSLF